MAAQRYEMSLQVWNTRREMWCFKAAIHCSIHYINTNDTKPFHLNIFLWLPAEDAIYRETIATTEIFSRVKVSYFRGRVT